MPKLIVETALVLVAGVVLALLANALSANGLELGRDYFPRALPVSLPAVETGTNSNGRQRAEHEPGDRAERRADGHADPAAPAHHGHGEHGADDAMEDPGHGLADEPGDASTDDALDAAIVQRLADKGLQAISHDDTVAVFEDPMREAGAYLFVDARNDELFAAGHIPGALQFDHYYADRYIEAILQWLPAAQKVIVYCTGGDCEDSESAAVFLQQYGADPQTLFVYTGGITEWKAQGLPIETSGP